MEAKQEGGCVHWREWVGKWIGRVIGIMLVVLGLLGLWRCKGEFLRSLSDASLVAGILTITVDPFLKRRFAREVGEDIFHHLLGIDLPIEIRETLRDFLQKNRHYRKDVAISAHVKRHGDGVLVEVKMDATVVAAADTIYRQYFAGELSQKSYLKEVGVTCPFNPKRSYAEKDVKLELKKDEPGVFQWLGKKFSLYKNQSLRSHFHYTVEKGLRDFYVMYFGASVINPTLRVSADEDLVISASKASQQNGDEYCYKKVFIEGDHINIRWHPRT
jgi:hypothetical protein